MDKHICRNCDHHFSGGYCSNCGQKLAHRITMKHLLHDILHAFTHADKGFFHMMIGLFKNPGRVAREYILEEKRKRYFTPFQYILIISTVATIVVVNSHFMEGAIKAMSVGSMDVSNRQAMVMKQISDFQSTHYNLLILIQLPFLALSTFWIYRKFRYNYAEHLTLHTFITAQTTLISMVLMLLLFFVNRENLDILRIFSLTIGLISCVYHITMYMQFFRQKSFSGFLRALAAYILGLVIFFVAVAIVSTIIGFVFMMIYRK